MSLTGFLSYSRVNWQQSPSKSTPLSAANLNVMDAGIKNNNDMISNLRDEVTQLNNDIINVPHIWINCNGASIFSYFSPSGKDGIYSVYNISDVPEAIARQYITVIKTNERMFVINHSGLFITEASLGKWNKIWYAINANKL
jgi:hypothetical protein